MKRLPQTTTTTQPAWKIYARWIKHLEGKRVSIGVKLIDKRLEIDGLIVAVQRDGFLIKEKKGSYRDAGDNIHVIAFPDVVDLAADAEVFRIRSRVKLTEIK